MRLRPNISFEPIPERSKIAGEPNVPEDKTTSLVARTILGVLSAPDSVGRYSTPVAFPSLNVCRVRIESMNKIYEILRRGLTL